jgi:hypothetical protein
MVMAVDHARDQVEQQEPGEDRKHALSTPTGDRDLDAAAQVPGNAARRSPV